MTSRNAGAPHYNVVDARDFFERTAAIDMSGSTMMRAFLSRLPGHARILDAGCGSGRDAMHFAALGHDVCAFDAHPELVALAREHMGVAVMQLTFAQVDFEATFDGIWACASLLHLPPTDLPDALARLTRALAPGGVLAVSFKHGRGARHDRAGRYFNDLDEAGVRDALEAVDGLATLETFTAPDAGGRAQDWTIGLARKSGGQPSA